MSVFMTSCLSYQVIHYTLHFYVSRFVCDCYIAWDEFRCTDFNPADVAESLGGSIERLQCDYLDLYLVNKFGTAISYWWYSAILFLWNYYLLWWKYLLRNLVISLLKYISYKFQFLFTFAVCQLHWPLTFKKDAKFPITPEDFAPLNINATWAVLEKCYGSGSVRAIGISNFSVEKTKALLSNCKVRPAVNQVECHPIWQQKKLSPYLKSEGIHLSVSLQILPC